MIIMVGWSGLWSIKLCVASSRPVTTSTTLVTQLSAYSPKRRLAGDVMVVSFDT